MRGGEYKKCFQNEVSRQLLGVVWQPPSFPNNLFLKIFSFCFLQKFARLQSIFPDISKPGSEQAFLPVTSPGKHSGPVTLPKTETVWVGSLLVFTKPSAYQISVPECCLDKRRMSPTLRWQPSSEVLNLTVGSTLLPATGSWAPLHDHEAWGHHCFSMAVSLVFHAAIWSTSSMLFQSCKSYGEDAGGARTWAIWTLWASLVTDSQGQLSSSTSGIQLFEFVLFRCISPDVSYLAEVDRPSCEPAGKI